MGKKTKESSQKTNQQPRTPAGAQPSTVSAVPTLAHCTLRDGIFGTKLPVTKQPPAKKNKVRHWKVPTSPSSASSASSCEPTKKSARFFTAAETAAKNVVPSNAKVVPEKTYVDVVKTSAPRS